MLNWDTTHINIMDFFFFFTQLEMHIWKMPGCVITGFRIPRWHVNMVQDERSNPLCELISHRNQILRVWVRVRGQRSRGEAACVLQLWPRLTSDLWLSCATGYSYVLIGDRQDVLCQRGHGSFLPFLCFSCELQQCWIWKCTSILLLLVHF